MAVEVQKEMTIITMWTQTILCCGQPQLAEVSLKLGNAAGLEYGGGGIFRKIDTVLRTYMKSYLCRCKFFVEWIKASGNDEQWWKPFAEFI